SPCPPANAGRPAASKNTPGPGPRRGDRHRRSSGGAPGGRGGWAPPRGAGPPSRRRAASWGLVFPTDPPPCGGWRRPPRSRADPPEQVLHPTGAVADPEGVLKPLADLIGGAEAAGADLLFELVHLPGGEVARVAPVLEDAQGVEPLVAIDSEPFAQLAEADPQQRSALVPAFRV